MSDRECVVDVEQGHRISLVGKSLEIRLAQFCVSCEAASLEVVFVFGDGSQEVRASEADARGLVAVLKSHVQAVLFLVVIVVQLVQRFLI